MIFIKHRINSVTDLKLVPDNYGVEVDVRYHCGDLILEHDALKHHLQDEQLFEEFLKEWQHSGPMILNVKTEGLERQCIALMTKYGIENWFFLDLSMPYFVIYSNLAMTGEVDGFGPNNLAVRHSEFEALEYAISFENKVKWVWVDCFSTMPLTEYSYSKLKACGFKICIVSPELQGHPLSRISEFREALLNMEIDAVCTKRPDLWQ